MRARNAESWFASRCVARFVAVATVFVFGLIVPAHLGGSDHHHPAHRPHAHAATGDATAALRDCSQCLTQELLDSNHEHDHHGHDHRLSLPRKAGSGLAKDLACSSETAFGVAPRALKRTPIAAERLPHPKRTNLALPQPRGPPHTSASIA